MSTSPSLYHRHRFPAEFISHCVWLYFRFALSYRDIEEIMAVQGVTLTYETVRTWFLKFGQIYANALRRKHPRLGDHWHLDEMFIRVNGRVHYLWRAVDQDGEVLKILVQSRRDKGQPRGSSVGCWKGYSMCRGCDRHGPTRELPSGQV